TLTCRSGKSPTCWDFPPLARFSGPLNDGRAPPRGNTVNHWKAGENDATDGLHLVSVVIFIIELCIATFQQFFLIMIHNILLDWLSDEFLSRIVPEHSF